MKEHLQTGKPFPLAKFVAVVALLATILVLGWKHRTEENQAVAIHGIQVSASAPAFAKSRNEQAPAEGPARETEAAPVTVKLEGKFSPTSEPLLLKQLERIGYFEFWDYRLNADGSAVIMALRGQSARQPVVTIVVDKQGKASATSRDFS